jgi:hypothetical protein
VLRCWIGALIGIVACLLTSEGRPAQPENPRGENLLPDTTVGVVAITNFDQLRTQWHKTQIGHLMNDPVMESFSRDIKKQLESRWVNLEKRLGLTLDDLKNLPSGEVDIALIRPAPGQAATAILVDCAGHLDNANAVLDKVSANLLKQGAKKTQSTVEGIKVTRFDVPKTENADAPKRVEAAPAKEPAPATAKKAAAPAAKAKAEPKVEPDVEHDQVVYFLEGNLLVATDDFPMTQGIIARLKGKQDGTLASVKGFQEVMKRCQDDLGQGVPQARWFLHPVGYADAARANTPEEDRRPGKSILEIMQNQGFSAIGGVGGYVDLCPKESYELIHRTAVYAPPPYEKSMKMLVFPNGADYSPQPWVPRDIATYTTFYVDILNAFDNFGPFFGELFGDTEPVCSIDIAFLKDLESGRLSPEFFQAVADKTKTLTIEVRKKDGTSEYKKFTLSKESKAVTQVPGVVWNIIDNENNEKYMVKKGERKEQDKKSNKIVKVPVLKITREMIGLWEEALEGLRTQESGPHIDLRKEFIVHLGQRVTMLSDYELPITTTSERLLFAVEIKDEKAVAAAVEKLMKSDPPPKKSEEFGCVIWEAAAPEETDTIAPPVVAVPSLNIRNEESKSEAPPEKAQRLLPHLTVTVADGHLLAASHREFLLKVLKQLKSKDERTWLGRSADYQTILGEIDKSGVQAKCIQLFSRVDEEFRPTYELIRQGKMPEAETILARVINTFSTEGRKGELRHQKIEGKNMPEYDVVRHYLGPAAFVGTSEPNGWFFRGFLLTKESE